MSANRELVELLAERLNAGDLEGWVALYSEDLEFVASDDWPETSTVRGRDGLREFWAEFSGVWENVQIQIDRLHEGEDAVVAECRWITRGRASGVEGTLEFVLGIWVRDGLIVRGQFFDELDVALAAADL
jgi:ketosteroid isomerase-like protein